MAAAGAMGQQLAKPDADAGKWSCGPISQARAEETVKMGSTGAYLIRSVPDRKDLHVLTVNDGGSALHYPINGKGGAYAFAGLEYPSMGMLVKAVAENGVQGSSGILALTMCLSHMVKHTGYAAAYVCHLVPLAVRKLPAHSQPILFPAPHIALIVVLVVVLVVVLLLCRLFCR